MRELEIVSYPSSDCPPATLPCSASGPPVSLPNARVVRPENYRLGACSPLGFLGGSLQRCSTPHCCDRLERGWQQSVATGGYLHQSSSSDSRFPRAKRRSLSRSWLELLRGIRRRAL